ncbi:MAG: hypothetical protein M1829_005579 [Trizodia sp. TS-e1964]|nr:MAG: hypothetical protein M1829_005579 [Trizodia sp. TS-e1964]
MPSSNLEDLLASVRSTIRPPAPTIDPTAEHRARNSARSSPIPGPFSGPIPSANQVSALPQAGQHQHQPQQARFPGRAPPPLAATVLPNIIPTPHHPSSTTAFLPPRGPCAYKPTLLTPTCTCLRYMSRLGPFAPSSVTTSASTSGTGTSRFHCDGCAHHASYHALENEREEQTLARWRAEAALGNDPEMGGGLAWQTAGQRLTPDTRQMLVGEIDEQLAEAAGRQQNHEQQQNQQQQQQQGRSGAPRLAIMGGARSGSGSGRETGARDGARDGARERAPGARERDQATTRAVAAALTTAAAAAAAGGARARDENRWSKKRKVEDES